MRSFRFGWTTLAALAFVVMVAQVSLAQQEGRRRGGREGGFGGGPGGGGMMSGVRLASLEPVEKALKLTDEQKDKIKDINDKVREDMRAAFEGGAEGARDKIQEVNKTAADDLKKVLDEGQQKRLMGIMIQVAGAAAIADPAVAKELNVTEDQKKKLEEVRDSIREEMRGLFTGGRDNTDREAMREKMEKMREDSNKKITAVLTSEQQAQLEQLKGEKVEIDLAALRGPGGRGGDRQRGGGRGNRGERNPESKSEN